MLSLGLRSFPGGVDCSFFIVCSCVFIVLSFVRLLFVICSSSSCVMMRE